MRKVINQVTKKNKPRITRKKDLSSKFLYWLAVLSGVGFLGSICAGVLGIGVFIAFSSTLPSPTKLTNRPIEQSTKIFDRNGELLYSAFNDKNRTIINIDEVSPYILDATLAAEDADFYVHEGIDPFGMIRSVLINLTSSSLQGGSTLTQQVAKTALLTQDRTLTRKIKDVVLALQIERAYTKDQILQMYLNEVPYGGTTWGVEAASKTYFGKSANELNLAEAALLAGLPQRPSYYSPFTNPEAAINRQKYVLKLMHERGWVNRNGDRKTLTDQEYEDALNYNIEFAKIKGVLKAPHFVMYVLNILRDKYGEDYVQNRGLNVVTTIDLSLQEKYEQIVKEEVDKADSLGVGNGALVAIDPKTRQILAMVGSKDYFSEDYDGQVNVVVARRQPGSTLKPITYLAGLMKGYTASTVMYDVYTDFDRGEGLEPYSPKNYGGWGFRGPIQVRYALANSVNVTAVKMLDLVGIQTMVDLANNLGVKSLHYDPSKQGLALTLGGGEVELIDLANGYASLAAGGVAKDVSAILEVKDYKGNVIDQYFETKGVRVVDEGLAFIITDILSDNNARAPAFGTRSQLYIPNNKVAVKTGTSNDLKDNWTVGFTPDIAIGVWVGNNDGTSMNDRLASGLTGAAPIWNRAINEYIKDHPNKEFTKPENVTDAIVGSLSGMVPYEDKEERRVEYFIKGTEPKAKSEMFTRVKICKSDEIKDKVYITYTAEKPEWQKFVDSWVENKYKDDEDQLFLHMGPDFEKEKSLQRFDLDNCGDD